ncbi:MAG: LysR family transcriptional regulator [Gammaproteobacteria bacterium]|uniref:LysR family transcriptional regulator n=1 Tax=Limnobacter sp. TaxID=2003368 RepID=UPI001D9C2585|nr:LysR family transcriptional regulator [Limnobacter sp.]MBU0785255.1 LysR family transcriptional regulator [Gammaproteobacteria bacterium]MBU0849293.1 LysR family transcriptional regulator [Gammaproteobacteria bacterium]MBU1267757.1 LysR family transcriptional regulator [Gammaproteobacteria bacterium]MBU1528201.1 LysR family transcriptional regulator [Gammaproteobacteria bacterium]MBU1781630.1 LysR family transcriptional regulator [Gammaproteobacteria bacterium]
MKQLSDLAFFNELVRHDSLASAAMAFDVTPPAVSRRLAALEKRLGVRLLHRSTRRIGLSAEGERYLEEGAQILRQLDALEATLRAGQDTPRGLLRVNASLGFGRKHMAHVVSAYHAEFPAVEVILELTDHPIELIEGGFDVSVRFGEPPDQRLIAQKLASNRRILCAAPSYLARAGALGTPADLTRQDCLVIRQENHTFNNWQLRNGKQETTVKVRGPVSSNDGDVSVLWALQGKGVLLRSEWDIQQELKNGALVRVLTDWAGAPADIFAVCPYANPMPAKTREFIRVTREVLASKAGFIV